ncbi:MAG: KH domain-containing protein, partial [Bdellovibrionaceae bacterium]|nr:KH domain-containing protein [Bdellovibrio sp.]
MDNLKELVEHMAKSLVDKPENVAVDEIPGQQTTLLAHKVDKEDLGKVIGKQGKTAAA